MPTPDVSNSAQELFDLLEKDILACHTCKDGMIEVSIRKIGTDEFEVRVISFRGSFRCVHADLNRYLEELPTDRQSQVSIYRDRFRVGLRGLLKNGFGLLSLDFSKCKRGNTAPIFGWMVSELLDID
ncbi:hypothetical protein CDG76_06815 [Nostoc sp. 'Peltigera membranacea cyanobiont' 210A]|uniref:hypothetical protein n=1 Tax=Nostoc sp. 'Peltigera membranacea cyanobiont' 210A TaxID=2014529 RepID=UPI000B95A1F1|nr:hypothetical protein [Nostoc sp. 'Peltigera membranacea cyanobiont' 210A]OYD96486.1 hypothetical protein CDG76_06815 [Nostoc sp. 'Peltigera membranacea cyanobiont' 210A]